MQKVHAQKAQELLDKFHMCSNKNDTVFALSRLFLLDSQPGECLSVLCISRINGFSQPHLGMIFYVDGFQ